MPGFVKSNSPAVLEGGSAGRENSSSLRRLKSRGKSASSGSRVAAANCLLQNSQLEARLAVFTVRGKQDLSASPDALHRASHERHNALFDTNGVAPQKRQVRGNFDTQGNVRVRKLHGGLTGHFA